MSETEEVAKRLYEACLSGSVETLNELIGTDKLVLNRVSSTECFSSDTPLHVAVSCGHLEFTKALLRWKPKLATELDSRRCSPLHLASTEGHFEIVHELLRVNTDTDVCVTRDQDGRTPLHLAVLKGRVEAVEYLLGIKSVKDHANDKNQNGFTALEIVEHCPNRDLKTKEIRDMLQGGVRRSVSKSPPQRCCKPREIFMRCISWVWIRFKVDPEWLKEDDFGTRDKMEMSNLGPQSTYMFDASLSIALANFTRSEARSSGIHVDGGNTIDFYINVVALLAGLNSLLLPRFIVPALSVWVAYKESGWLNAFILIVLLICFGSQNPNMVNTDTQKLSSRWKNFYRDYEVFR
ncbi:hypothetical protein RHSIM_Rhsim03G0061300 [Rhododendron simsii]|uniref:PGG domain-containing protein n=1 Tax=Rhododendron simsii TaxID=118357 RepID=A0A834H5U4_RHOSS|nr:hypothetical protein RHSIM_Rhsim03G0061300 [Rhododendron simsii]